MRSSWKWPPACPSPAPNSTPKSTCTADSFIVRVPTSVLPVSGSWQVRLAAGLANAAGTEFATVAPEDGGIPGATNVYNVTFRTLQAGGGARLPDRTAGRLRRSAPLLEGELGASNGELDHIPVAECGNIWMENDQANTLASGDVSKYALAVNWAQLAATRKHARTPADRLLQPLVCDTA